MSSHARRMIHFRIAFACEQIVHGRIRKARLLRMIRKLESEGKLR